MVWLANTLIGTGATLEKYRRRQRRQATIRELSALDDRILNDIGLSRGNISAVAAKRADGKWHRHARQGSAVRVGE